MVNYHSIEQEKLERELERIRNDETLTNEEKQYLCEKAVENMNDTIRKMNKGE